jgi:MEDS: MEthanogen/methylotroph, DcmR Sensory domain
MKSKYNTSTDSGHFHAVRFYKDSSGLTRIVADFIGDGLAAGEPAIVIATPDHRSRVIQNLKDMALDVERLEREGELFLLDAEETLSMFMVDGMPNAELFTDAIVPVIERACRGRKDCIVRAYGEMVDVLWKAGHTVAATRLEMLWNGLAASHRFSLLCGYAMGNFYKDAAVEDICSHHSHVIGDSGDASLFT